MGFQSCILAIIGAAAAEQAIESRAASGKERLVRRLTSVIRILADAVALTDNSGVVSGPNPRRTDH
jgi:hypothetical protein